MKQWLTHLLTTIGTVTPDALVATDGDERVIAWNAPAEHLLGYSADEMVGKPLTTIIPDDLLAATNDCVERLRRGERVGPLDTFRISKSGTQVPVRLTAVPLTGPDGTMWASVRMLTEQRPHDHPGADAAELAERVLHLQKAETVGRLAAGLAHDFNNFLTPILGYSDMLLSTSELGDASKSHAHEIAVNGRRAALLTHQLLSYGRRRETSPEPVHLNAVVADLEPTLRSCVGEAIEFHLQLDPELTCIRADVGHLQQALMNLVLNARDAMPRGGRLTVETTRRTGEDGRPLMVLAVHDTGIGMTADVRARVFDPYFTTKGDSGTGLGLPTVVELVTRYEGHVSVESTPGEGSVFRLSFPAGPAAATVGPEGLADDATASTSPPAGHPVVLVVEDDAGVRRFLREALASVGYQVVEAETSLAALTRASEIPALDVLVTDVVLPHLTGVALAARLRTRFPHLRAVLISGHPEHIVRGLGLGDGTCRVLEKPFTAGQLQRAIADADSPAPG
jgi:PAS domain S-box-containing protein